MTRLCLAVIVLSACSSSNNNGSTGASAATTTEAPLTTTQPPPTTEPAPVEAPPEPADDRYYTNAELAAAGIRIAPESAFPAEQMFGPDGPTPTISGYQFLCGDPEDQASCLCRRPLPCEADAESGPCITLDQNLEAFRSALGAGGDRQVYCEHAEVGRCGEFKYFYFQGDIHRYELRFFDPEGKLVAQRNSTDYNEYCNHTALVRWMGRVPKCDRLERDELICGAAERPLRAPLDEIRAFMRGH